MRRLNVWGSGLLLVIVTALPLACGDGDGPGGCVVLTTRPLNGAAFTGSDGCAGVHGNLVLLSSTETNAHNDAYCDTLHSCSAGSGCSGAPGFAADVMVVYVFGTASGCGATATIEEVRSCPTAIEVDYRIQGSGACATMINAWASAWVPASDLPVEFNQL